MKAEPDDQARFDQPYPLLRSFVRLILPGLALLLVVSAALTMYGARQLVEGIYLELAMRRAQVIDRAMTEVTPEPWQRLKSGDAPGPIYAEPQGQLLLAELTREVRELDLTALKIYANGGVIQFDTDTGRIGSIDRSAAYVAAERGESSLVYRIDPNGSALYELYVLVAVPGSAPVVFELYEPVDHLNALLWRAGAAAAGVPSLILLGLMLAMTRMVVLAQNNITGRAALVADLRARLERLVSGAASRAVHRAVGTGSGIRSARARCTLFYSDIRDFTSFSEANEPEQVIGFLNRLMAIIVDEVDRAGGDVDKLIGDAVLARFQGDRGEVRAISAAREALRRLDQTGFPRGVGIGIYTGDVIFGTVGSADRMDFTVIGDSVNITARLCSIAARGELVVDTDTVRTAGDHGFGAEESAAIKGRRERLTVRRWRLDAPETAAGGGVASDEPPLP